MSRVYKRPESRTLWWVDIRWRGRKIREPGGDTKAAAQDYLANRLKELDSGEMLPSRKREAFDLKALETLWLTSAKAEGKRSLRDDTGRFGAILQILGSATMVDALTPDHIERLVKGLRAGAHNGGRKLAHSTINRHTSLLRSALKLAAARGHKHRDPLAGHKGWKEPGRKRAPTDAEMKALLEAAEPELRAILTLAIETGARLGEITAFLWAWWDPKASTIRLPGSATKTGQEREVPLSSTAAAVINGLPRRPSEPGMFALSRDRASNKFHHLTRRLGIEDLRLHDLRRGAASNMRRAGADIATISDVLGHQSLAMVRRYQLITRDDKVAAVERASALRQQDNKKK